jgi:hypothetical protein
MTCVIKQSELEFLRLYKFCVLLLPDIATNQEEKPVLVLRICTTKLAISRRTVLFAAWSVEYWPITPKL